MPTRETRRVKTSQQVRLTSVNAVEGERLRGEALLANVSPEGVCLSGMKWEPGTSRFDETGLIDLHIPLPDWIGVDVRVRPVRVRFTWDAVEVGAVIVRKPPRFAEALEALGYRERVEAG